jgi:hypothetical protein
MKFRRKSKDSSDTLELDLNIFHHNFELGDGHVHS